MRTYVFNNMTFYGAPNKYVRFKGGKARRIAIALAGLLIGAVNGIFGAGGGMLAVPALSFIAGYDDRKAHATAIAVILPLCLISSLVYSLRGSFDFAVVLPTAIGVLLGGGVGAALLKRLPIDSLSFIFYGLMLLAGIKMLT